MSVENVWLSIYLFLRGAEQVKVSLAAVGLFMLVAFPLITC
jgi:hypothetical protein